VTAAVERFDSQDTSDRLTVCLTDPSEQDDTRVDHCHITPARSDTYTHEMDTTTRPRAIPELVTRGRFPSPAPCGKTSDLGLSLSSVATVQASE
jgi:hypothetical protein